MNDYVHCGARGLLPVALNSVALPWLKICGPNIVWLQVWNT